jgi:hypothetical protein
MSFSPIVTGTGLNGWSFLQRTRDQQQAAFEQSPLIARDRARFTEKIQSIQTSEQLMDNRELLRVALGAFGLDEDINNRAFIQRVLDSDLSSSTSLANRLADKRYLALAQTFNFAGTSGPKIDGPTPEDKITGRLAAVKTADDLLSDPSLLRAALKTFGLQSDSANIFFLQNVLTSDLADANSFANRLSDTRYADMARTFDFHAKARDNAALTGFADLFSERLAGLDTAQDLLDSPELQKGALNLFGVDRDFANIEKPGFLLNVLESDPYDPDSFAAGLDDTRYLALSKAFAFGDTDTRTEDSRVGKLIAKLDARTTPIRTSDDLFGDVGLTLVTMSLYDLPQGVGKLDYAKRYVDSDPDVPTSLRNVVSDQRYAAFARAFPFAETSTGRTYPPGFAATLAQNYVDRQFEAGIGETDPDMRIALSMERDLNDLVSRGGTTDSQWFSVMASKPMRAVFESAFRLPASFGSLDVDQQLKIFKDRSEQFYGTENVSDYAEPDRIDQLRRSFLLSTGQAASGGTTTTTSAGVVLAILSGISVR